MENQEVGYENPNQTAESSGVFVPLHIFGAGGENVAEVEPRPGEVPVEVQKFPRTPERDKGDGFGDAWP